MALIPIYTASNEAIIGVVQGIKSKYDFKVKYREPGKHERTPKHMHIIIDLFMKLIQDEQLTMRMVDHIIGNVIKEIQPVTTFPPSLQIFKPNHANYYIDLNNYGEYPVDFLLVVTELIQIQEKTNYPTGTMNLGLFEAFRRKDDIFSIVSAATFR